MLFRYVVSILRQRHTQKKPHTREEREMKIPNNNVT